MICEAAVSSGLQGVEWAIGTAQSLGADDTAFARRTDLEDHE